MIILKIGKLYKERRDEENVTCIDEEIQDVTKKKKRKKLDIIWNIVAEPML